MQKKYIKNNWFKTPYYFNPSTKFKLKVSLVFGLFVLVFLYIFKPFDLALYKEHLLSYLLGMALIISICSFLLLFIPPLIFKTYFKEDEWTIGKNLFLILIGMFFIGSILRYYSIDFSKSIEMIDVSYGTYLLYTYLVGILPVSFVLYFNEKNVRERREKKAQEINNLKKEQLINGNNKLENKVTFNSKNKKDILKINVNNLVYVSSEGNYASFFIEQENRLEEKILRVTLTKIDEELKEYSYIFRCHKSYIINSKYIYNVRGNARGYLLDSKLVPFSIPVSRKFSKQSLESIIK